MKKALLCIFLVLSFIFCSMPVLADESSDFYRVGGELIKYKGTDSDVIIPNDVTSISATAFYGNALTSVKFSEGLTTIGEAAFYKCTNLASIKIPKNVTTIGENAFRLCNSLTSVTIPNGITSIENSTFSDCTSLSNITIPDSVTSINECAFAACTNLASITIPNSVTFIDEDAFIQCDKLTICGFKNSTAQDYANRHNIPFRSLDAVNVWLISISVFIIIIILGTFVLIKKKSVATKAQTLPVSSTFRQGQAIIWCQNCGAKCEQGAAFCGACGMKLIQPTIVYCKSCGTELEDGAKYCDKCGMKIEPKVTEIVCPKCSNSCKLTFKFCPECGQDLTEYNEKASEYK